MNTNLNFVDLSNDDYTLYLDGEVLMFKDYSPKAEDQWFYFVDHGEDRELNIWREYDKDGTCIVKAAIHDTSDLDTRVSYEHLHSIPVVTTYTTMKETDFENITDEELEDVIDNLTITDAFNDSLAVYVRRHDSLLYRGAMVDFLSGVGEEVLSKEEAEIYISKRRREKRKVCWQRNMKTEDYIPLLRRHFSSVEKKGKVLVCK